MESLGTVSFSAQFHLAGKYGKRIYKILYVMDQAIKTVFNYSNILDSDIALMLTLGSSFTKNARKRFIRSA